MDLKSPITNNSKVPLILHFQDAKGVKSQMEISLEAGMPHQH
jgi:copper(I)-binding protein